LSWCKKDGEMVNSRGNAGFLNIDGRGRVVLVKQVTKRGRRSVKLVTLVPRVNGLLRKERRAKVAARPNGKSTSGRTFHPTS
jgi:hypothetical protein